jgi:hypothetical protein
LSQPFDRLLDEGKKAPALHKARDFKRSFEQPLAIQFNTPLGKGIPLRHPGSAGVFRNRNVALGDLESCASEFSVIDYGSPSVVSAIALYSSD